MINSSYTSFVVISSKECELIIANSRKAAIGIFKLVNGPVRVLSIRPVKFVQMHRNYGR